MPPASYVQAAQAVYQPLASADISTATSNEQAQVANDEAAKGQIGTDYQSAIDKLTQSVQDQTGKINQLYSERLGGNFSGLQGNDLGQMYSRANESQSIIEETRANKLSQITTDETNAQNTLLSDVSSIQNKYQSEEQSAAQSSYASDIKAAQTQANSDRSYELSLARLGESESNSATSAANKLATDAAAAAAKYKVASLSSGNLKYTGPNGETNLYQYAQGVNGGGTADPDAVLQTIQQTLATGSTTDKGAANGITALQKQGLSTAQIMQRLAKSNAYIFT